MSETSREVAAAIIVGTCGRILLQQRDDVPNILYPGMIGLFGGHMEAGETPLQCAQREIEEEIGFAVPAERLQPLVTLRMEYPGNRLVVGTFYILRDVPVEGLVVTEGSLLAVEVGALANLMGRMTPSAGFVAKVFLLQQSKVPGPEA